MQLFNHLKLRNKFLIVYILSVFIPIVFSNYFFYLRTTDRFLEQKRTDINLVVDQVEDEFKRLTDQAIGLTTTLFLDVRLYDFLDYNYASPIDYVEAYNEVIRQYNTSTPLYHSIQNLIFYTNNPTFIFSGGVSPITMTVINEPWYDEIQQTNRPFLYHDRNTSEELQISVIKKLNYFYLYDSYEKILQIKLNPVAFRQIFNNVTLQGHLYLLDESGYIVYTNDPDLNWGDYDVQLADLELSDDHIVTRRLLSDNYFEKLEIVGVVDSAIFFQEKIEDSSYILILSLVNFILPTFIIFFLSKSIHSRLGKVLRHMKKIEKQHFEEYPYVEYADEIGQITRQINRMTRKINQLFNDVFRANLEKKDLQLKEKQAQLSALQSQINPHFLFNSLETIRMRSYFKGEDETAQIIEHMAGIFRNALTWGKDWVPVANELKLIYAFLEIQKYRFGDKLSYEVNVDPAIKLQRIPNLVFLPFVENASIHGIEPLKENGRIEITITGDKDRIIFRITDNGVGMSQQQKDRILMKLKNEESMGENVGIQNVYYRLKLYYKQEFAFNLITEKEKGTTIEIRIPTQAVLE